MIYLGYIAFALAMVQLFVVIVNLIYPQKLRSRPQGRGEMVSVLVPARDEEGNIGNLLSDLISQTYIYTEILVYDDLSSDRTPEIVNHFSCSDRRVRLINGLELPGGWLGKNHGCYRLAEKAAGRHFLFLDADVRVENDFIQKIVRFAREKEVQLLSIFPVQRMKTAGEWLTVPLMNYILLSLLPLILVRKSRRPSLSAANGQCMLFEAGIYRKLQPHKNMKNSRFEDIDIARSYKRSGMKVACLASAREVSCRMYGGYNDAVKGFSKNVTGFFGNSLTFALLFWIMTTFGIIPVILVFSPPLVLAYISVILITRALVALISNQDIQINLLAFIPQQLSLGVIIFRSFLNEYYGKYLWKGRTI